MAEKTKSLVDKYVVHDEVGYTVQSNARSNERQVRHMAKGSGKKQENPGQGKNQEEVIVFLKKTAFILPVMIFMQPPENTMHNVLMAEPGYELHCNKGRRHR